MKLRTLSLAAAGCLVAAGSLAGTLSPASAATVGCRATYQIISQWQNGFQGDVAITNLGDPLSHWTVGFDFTNVSQKMTQGWNATWSQSGTHVSAANPTWNGSLGTGASLSAGFLGSWVGDNPAPDNFTLNGVACTGVTTTPTSPSATQTTRPTRRSR